ncbi:hydrophobin-3 [Aspergillus udagawae]|uniref:Hydrophobin n=1 Tax=Aspergillus udagawae TaxID=91492 RepID=A0ABQ1ADL2_9EURO|nr:hydrophobin-3 [Aspergillus udagawae]GFF79592.1 hydrophobin-3 [Aspergillus udagawae]GFG15780.1 hydrophobin-3 [Aspergillus udagawae]GFG24334.1 hydrophobin-3 [Aspergillus udagawae]
MKLSILTFLALVAVTAAIPVEDPTTSALKSQVEEIAGQVHGVEDQGTTTDPSQCVEPTLCCGSLTTPLDPILDPILLGLGINAAQIVGSVGLLCHPWTEECSSAPQCCTEANLLGGTLALGCSKL